MIRTTACSLLLLLAACATTVGAGDLSSVPDDVANTCESQCESLGLELEGVSIGDRSVDCLCEPDD